MTAAGWVITALLLSAMAGLVIFGPRRTAQRTQTGSTSEPAASDDLP